MKKIFPILSLILILIIMSLFITASFLIVSNPYMTNDLKLKESLFTLMETEEFSFNEQVPFEWEKMYSFAPGTSKEYIEKTIGISNSKIKDVPNDKDYVCYIFVDKGYITSYPCGKVQDIGYKFNIEMENDKHGVINYHDWTVFFAESGEGYINLTDIMLFVRKLNMA